MADINFAIPRQLSLRIYKEEIAEKVRTDFPQVADLYRQGKTARQIDLELGISELCGYKPGNPVNTAILETLRGYRNLAGDDIPGLIKDRFEYDNLAAQNQRTKGVSGVVRRDRAENASNAAIEKRGLPAWEDSEKYDVWLGMHSPEFAHVKGVDRKMLCDYINETYHDGQQVRTVAHIRNMMTKYRTVTKLLSGIEKFL